MQQTICDIMKWITRAHPRIDRIACPWLIRRFIDKDAEIVYVPFDQVLQQAKALNAIPFDIPGVEFSHYGDQCTFDYFIRKYQITDEAVLVMAPIVRGADTDRHGIASQASGLWAISAGLAYNNPNDYELLEKGMMLYDALYSWAKHLRKEKHTNQPFEHLLLDVFNKYLRQPKGANRKIPIWVKELKEMIQDQIDGNLTLKELSKNIDINPSYLSREFSKYFNDLSFGEYLQKQRIEKAKQLILENKYLLTEIAYLTGFSDQSHFTRIFRKHTGQNPSAFKKQNLKSNINTKG